MRKKSVCVCVRKFRSLERSEGGGGGGGGGGEEGVGRRGNEEEGEEAI